MNVHRLLLGHLLALMPFAASADAVSVYQRAIPSIVIVEAINRTNGISRQGSGVVIDASTVVTNCHVLENAEEILVGQPPNLVGGTRGQGSFEKDICLLHADLTELTPAARGSTSTLRVGSPVYAVGAPRGMSFTLSDGIVSQLRGEPPSIIQTTAAISPGSSGGGLFDADGTLIGITTFNIEGGQNLNFALPVEWIKEVASSQAGPVEATSSGYRIRFVGAYRAGNRRAAIDIARSWIAAFPSDAEGYYRLGLGLASVGGESLSEAIETFNRGLKIAPTYAPLWYQLGNVYRLDEQRSLAIAAYKEAIRLDPASAEYWANLGISQMTSAAVDSGIESLKYSVELDPTYAEAWHFLGLAYRAARLKAFRSNAYRRSPEVDAIGAASSTALRTAYELDPLNVQYRLELGYNLSADGNCDEARDLAMQIKADDPVSGLALEAHVSRELGRCR